MRKTLLPLAACLALVPLGSRPAQPPQRADPASGHIELPEGFAETVVATGLTGATAMAVAPDGRVFVCEQTGALRVVKDDVLLPTPFATFPVNSYWERGLL